MLTTLIGSEVCADSQSSLSHAEDTGSPSSGSRQDSVFLVRISIWML